MGPRDPLAIDYRVHNSMPVPANLPGSAHRSTLVLGFMGNCQFSLYEGHRSNPPQKRNKLECGYSQVMRFRNRRPGTCFRHEALSGRRPRETAFLLNRQTYDKTRDHGFSVLAGRCHGCHAIRSKASPNCVQTATLIPKFLLVGDATAFIDRWLVGTTI